MRISNTLTLPLLLCLGIAACMDHNGQVSLPARQPAPVTEPDQKIIDPLITDEVGAGTSGQNGGGNVSGGNLGNGTGGSPGGGGTPPPGGPVPEPTTMLLVGTGLAGAAILRRKRKPPQ